MNMAFRLGVIFIMAYSMCANAIGENVSSLSRGLVGHWRFAGDFKDSAGNGLETECRGATMAAEGPAGAPGGACVFDGEQAHLVVKDHPALNFGAGDFSLALWVHTREHTGDIVGDIMSKFDCRNHKGFTFNVVTHAGVTTSQSNWRNVQFGVDDGVNTAAWRNRTSLPEKGLNEEGPLWRDCGRPGNAVFVTSLAVFDGALYAGTVEWGEDEAGHVYRYLGDGQWEDCGSPAPCNAVWSLAVHDGALYCGVTRYKTTGSCLPPSPNQNVGGKVLRYAGGTSWEDCGKLDGGDGIGCMVSFKGTLYAAPFYHRGVYAYRGDQKWERTGPDARVMSMGFWKGKLYGLTSGRDAVYVMEEDGRWEPLGKPDGTIQLYSFAVFRGAPYIGTWPNADIFRLNGNPDAPWQAVGSPGYSKEVMGMAVYNGGLFVGTLPMADVYRYDGEVEWIWTGTVDNSPNARLRRAWSMAVWNGKLFCGLLPSGRVSCLEVGKVASHDYALAPGWRHLAAVRESGILTVYVDGKLAGASSDANRTLYNVSNDKPLLIGAGVHDYFKGSMSDLRMYNRALTASELRALSAQADVAVQVGGNPTR